MREFLIILTCIFSQTAFGQFGIIADKDGFVNVRNSPNISNNIVDTLTNGQIVFCLEAEGEWRPIDYDFNRQRKSGYIHNSRVKFLKDFDKIPYHNLTDSSISFKKDSIKLIVTKTKFQPKNNKLQYHKGDTSKNQMSYLEKINGKEIWGTDGDVPKNQYGQITLTLGKNRIYLPIDNLFEPNLDNTIVNIDTKNRTIYISASNSDGAGGYEVLWIVANGKLKQRITTVGF
ncbi:MAG: SH3 domain-containing protein [Flavobacteriales bacterium]|nr:SH3 domain-containing protein [Flavobacteriales bacterium]